MRKYVNILILFRTRGLMDSKKTLLSDKSKLTEPLISNKEDNYKTIKMNF